MSLWMNVWGMLLLHMYSNVFLLGRQAQCGRVRRAGMLDGIERLCRSIYCVSKSLAAWFSLPEMMGVVFSEMLKEVVLQRRQPRSHNPPTRVWLASRWHLTTSCRLLSPARQAKPQEGTYDPDRVTSKMAVGVIDKGVRHQDDQPKTRSTRGAVFRNALQEYPARAQRCHTRRPCHQCNHPLAPLPITPQATSAAPRAPPVPTNHGRPSLPLPTPQ
jgi:hypothetical protein